MIKLTHTKKKKKRETKKEKKKKSVIFFCEGVVIKNFRFCKLQFVPQLFNSAYAIQKPPQAICELTRVTAFS